MLAALTFSLMELHNSIKALVIEDDREMANLLKRIIGNKFSFDVEVAYDCATARRRLLEQDFDIVTLDYRLPDGAGLDLLDEITEGGRDHPPVIMVTGHGDEETAARSFRSRASGYVVKDAKLPEMLVDAVEKAIAEISLKRVEKELLEEKVFIEDALNGLPDLFMVINTEGKFFRWNEKVSEISGYSNAEVSNMNVVELFREEDRPRLIEGMRQPRDEGYELEEVVLETKQGERRYYDLAGRMLKNYDGITVGYSGIGRDVSERVKEREELKRNRDMAEAAARASEAHFRSIMDNAVGVIAILDSMTNVLDISPSIEKVLGYTPEFTMGKSVLDFVHPDDRDRVFAVHTGVAEGEGESDAAECRFKHADGTWHWLLVSGRIFQAEGDVRIIVDARDITESRAAREALRESEWRYKSIFALTPDFVFLMNPQGRLVEVSKAVVDRIGLPVEEILKTSVMDYFAGDDPSQMLDAFKTVNAGREVRGLEVPGKTAKGPVHLYDVNGAPIIEDGEVVGILVLARDITGRKKTEEELKRLNRELDGYAQTVSHDLKNPLTTIKLAADHLGQLWAKRDSVDDLDAEVKRVAEILKASATQAETLIADLLSLARAGQQPEEVSDVDVRATVMRIIEEHEPVVAERGVSFIVADDLGKVRANPTHVYQLFSNLIDNGIKHNHNPSPVVEVEYLGDGSAGHVYRVRDNGDGIRPQDADSIFLPFFKGEDGSTGIGLTIVEKLVKLYGGEIKVYANGGACFEFSLKDR